MKTKNCDEDRLWKRYKEDNSQKAKEELILNYVPLVKHIAGKIIVKLPDEFEYDDLVSYGFLGLIDAMKRYDYNRNIKFSTYAVSRIKGSIYDEIRSLDWVPQSIRRKSKDLSRTYAYLEEQLGGNPTDKEVREELGLNEEEFNKLLVKVNIPQNVSLESMISSQDNNKLKLKDLVQDSEEKEPENTFFYDEMKRILGQTIERLPEKEKLVVSLYYYDDLTLTEIGEVMELTTARISQLHTKAIFRLRGYLSRKKSQLVG